MDDYAEEIREQLTEEGRALLAEIEQVADTPGADPADDSRDVIERMERLSQTDQGLIVRYLDSAVASRRAAMDQYESGTHDIERIAELCGKASFPTDGMNVGQIVERMAAVGDITADERREVYEITERIPVIEVPRDSEE